MGNIKSEGAKKKSNLILLIKHDFYMGTVAGWKRYVVVLGIFIFLCFIFQMNLKGMKNPEYTPNTSDYIINIYRGMDIIRGDDYELQSQFPKWFLVNVFLSFVIGYYPLKDLKEFGPQMLLRSKKRWQWWISKCIWVIYNVIIYYIIGYIVIFVFSLLGGGASLLPTKEISEIFSKINTESLTSHQMFIIGIILPIITSIALSIVQLLISLFSNSIIGNMVIIFVLLISVFKCSSFFLGNYLMIFRNTSLLGVEGVNFSVGILFSVVLIIFSIGIGVVKFNKCDI